MAPPMRPPGSPGPDSFGPGGALYAPVVPPQAAPVFPSYTGTAPAGTQLFYSSAQFQTVVASDNGSTLSIGAITGLPQLYPFKLLLEWGTSNQEVVIITSAPSGNGPYTFTGVLRGMDGGGPQVTHSAGAQVNHGVSAADFFQIAPVFNVCGTQYAGGADPTGTLDITAAYQATVNACIAAGGGIVQFPPGNFKQLSTVTANVNDTAVYIQGAGRWATTIAYHGSGDCLRIYDSSNYGPRTANGGGITGLTIDGTNASGSAASTGLHMGDIFQYTVDIAVQNFTTAGSIGVWFDNQYYWTEQLRGQVFAQNCASHVVFDNSSPGASTSTGSFERMDLTVCVNQTQAAFDGVVFQNGAFLVDGSLRYQGNFGGSASPLTSATLRLTGSTPGGHDGTTYSNISYSFLDIGVENTDSLAYNPQTIVFGGGGNYLNHCIGMLDFGAAGAFSNTNSTGNASTFIGVINGDTALTLALGFPTNVALQGGLSLGSYAGATSITGNGQTIDVFGAASLIPVTSSAAYTGLILQNFALDGQVVAILNTGNYPLTFAAPGTSYVADGVNDVIPAGQMALYVNSQDTGLWYRTPQGNGEYTACLSSTFTASAAGTGAQNVTGLSAYLNVGTYTISGYLPYQGAVAAGTTHFGFTFGGTAGTGSIISWQTNLLATPFTAAPVTSATITTVSQTSATLTTSPGAFYEVTMTVAATAAGTLQLQVYNGTTGDDTEVLAGAFLEVTQVA